MKTKKQMYITMFIVAIVAGLFTWAVNNFIVYGVTDETTGKYRTAMSAIKRHSYNDVSDLELQEGSIHGLVDSIGDPYSAYLTAEEVEDFEQNFNSEYVGLGIKTTKIISGFLVVDVAQDSPAEISGIEVDDIIVKVNDKRVETGTTTLSTMLYNTGTLSSLTVLRDGKEIELPIEKATVDYSQSISSIVEKDGENIMLINMQQFTDKTSTLLKDDIALLTEQKKVMDSSAKNVEKSTAVEAETTSEIENTTSSNVSPRIDGVIFDLRNNEGGRVKDAEDILNQLIPSEFAYITVKGKEPANDEETTETNVTLDSITAERQEETKYEKKSSLNKSPLDGMPTVILVNEKTASSAEMVAQALQHTVNGQVVGNATAGKSTIQKIIPLRDGSGIKLTTDKWYGLPMSTGEVYRDAEGNIISDEDGKEIPITEKIDVSKTPVQASKDEDKVVDAFLFTQSSIGATQEYTMGDSDKGDEETISRVQMILNYFGYNVKRTDGLFDEETKNALAQFQEDNDIEVTSKIDRDSLFVMNKKINEYTGDSKNDDILQRGFKKINNLISEKNKNQE